MRSICNIDFNSNLLCGCSMVATDTNEIMFEVIPLPSQLSSFYLIFQYTSGQLIKPVELSPNGVIYYTAPSDVMSHMLEQGEVKVSVRGSNITSDPVSFYTETALSSSGDIYIKYSSTEERFIVCSIVNPDEQRVLWKGNHYMSETQTAYLSEKITDQKNGVVLVWCKYDPTQAISYKQQASCFFVPKWFITGYVNEDFDGGEASRGLSMYVSSPWYNAVKYCYINDDSVSGHSMNNDDGFTVNGVTYNNRRFVLAYIVGV